MREQILDAALPKYLSGEQARILQRIKGPDVDNAEIQKAWKQLRRLLVEQRNK